MGWNLQQIHPITLYIRYIDIHLQDDKKHKGKDNIACYIVIYSGWAYYGIFCDSKYVSIQHNQPRGTLRILITIIIM
jgi:hypothetical protein